MSSSPNPFESPSVVDDVNLGAPFVEDVEAMLAERGTRFGASVVDGLLYVVALLPAIVIAALEQEEIAMAVGVLAYVSLGVYQWYLIATSGQSLAKRWFKIKIIREDGSPVDFVSGVVLRVWVIIGLSMVPFVGSFVGLVDALMIFGEERQCLHDRIAKTKVINVFDGDY